MIGRLEKNVIIARSGVYKYEPAALAGLNPSGEPPNGYDSREYFNVYRPAVVLMKAAEKFTKLPLIREHQAMIDGKNFRDYALGWTGDSAEIVPMPNSDEVGISSTVNLIDDDAIHFYDEGNRDVSPGYNATFKWAEGTSPDGEKYDIIMDSVLDVNHLAFTICGRGGAGVGMDSEFNEADHPRAANGQFGSGGGEAKEPEKPEGNKSEETKKLSAKEQGEALREKYKAKGVELVFYPGESKKAKLSLIRVEKDKRGQGLAKQAMQDIATMADENGITVELDPSADFGANKKKLVEFYKSFGFIENKGKNKDYEISSDMYRIPKGSANDSVEYVEAWDDDAKVDFDTAVRDIIANRSEYDDDAIKEGVEYLRSFITDIPDSDDKKILARLIDDFLVVKNAFPDDDAAKVAADLVVDRYKALDAKEDTMGLFGGKAKDAVPEEVKEEAPAPAEPAPEAPKADAAPPAPASEAPAAPVAAAAMEVAQMPDDVSSLDDAGLRACLNGLVKFAKAIAPGEAQEPQHQEAAPVAADAEPEEEKKEEKPEGMAGDSIFGMSLKQSAQQTKGIDDFLANISGRKGK